MTIRLVRVVASKVNSNLLGYLSICPVGDLAGLEIRRPQNRPLVPLSSLLCK